MRVQIAKFRCWNCGDTRWHLPHVYLKPGEIRQWACKVCGAKEDQMDYNKCNVIIGIHEGGAVVQDEEIVK